MTGKIVPVQRLGEFEGVELSLLLLNYELPYISGNKAYKLKYNLEEAKKQGKDTLLTFGGAFSNHILATAVSGRMNGFKTIGIIRGDDLGELNHMLRIAVENGMELHFVSRELYRDKEKLDAFVKERFQDVYIIPEGGANEPGVTGCKEIVKENDFDVICAACGTGTTLSGIILSLPDEKQALGFQVLKAENYIDAEVKKWLARFNSSQRNWAINEQYHFGGYAKTNEELLHFIRDFEKKYGTQLEQVYTGKMMYGIFDLIKKGHFRKGQKVLAVHTGGLQGRKDI